MKVAFWRSSLEGENSRAIHAYSSPIHAYSRLEHHAGLRTTTTTMHFPLDSDDIIASCAVKQEGGGFGASWHAAA